MILLKIIINLLNYSIDCAVDNPFSLLRSLLQFTHSRHFPVLHADCAVQKDQDKLNQVVKIIILKVIASLCLTNKFLRF